MSEHDPIEAIEKARLLAIVRRPTVENFVAEALREAGVRVVEISLLSGGAVSTIKHWRERFGELVVGAGTVTTAEDAEGAINAGASFLISPGLHGEVVERAAAAGIPYIPGALTPTEVHACAVAGARMIKLFPASRLGPAYVRDLLGPFPDLRLLPTGGIDASNARGFLAAGAVAVAVASALVGHDSTAETIAAKGRRLNDLIRTGPEGGA
jgi:2-dehydro-3-deoxyphosphogluconate aldolase / (4S)-4-hydroxy-2-oxoglutarate aldolase